MPSPRLRRPTTFIIRALGYLIMAGMMALGAKYHPDDSKQAYRFVIGLATVAIVMALNNLLFAIFGKRKRNSTVE